MLSEELRTLTTDEGFIKGFNQRERFYNTQEEAYEALEDEYKAFFGNRKYAYYDSFRQIRNRFYKQHSKSKSPNKQ